MLNILASIELLDKNMHSISSKYIEKEISQNSEKSSSWYKSVVDASPSGIIIIDVNGNVTFCSNKAAEILGLPESEIHNRPVLDIIHPDQHEDVMGRLKDLINENEDYNRSPLKFLPGTGAEIIVEGTACLYINEKGEKAGIIMMFNDSTEKFQQAKIIQQQIEDLNQKNEELKKYIDSNLQLENFAYIASHDLKAPIRSVISFAKLLTDSSIDKLSEKEQKFLKIISDSSEHMRELIDDLLIFSRVNTTKTVFDKVDAKKLVESILSDLQPEILRFNAEIVLSDMPSSIVADKTKLRQVFQNLIVNAMKFQVEGTKPIVQIKASENKESWIFKIIDNGIGIDPKHIDKIFLLFQKLHSKDKFEGSGMGLAISKKVLEQHNGTIYASNNQDQGCTIGFTISKDLKVSA